MGGRLNAGRPLYFGDINRVDIDIRLLYREIIWMADGYLRQAVLTEEFDAERIEQDFVRMIEQWKRVYLK